MSSCTLCTWEATSALFAGAFTNGGPASVVYGFIIATLGTLVVAASMAEMASMSVDRQKPEINTNCLAARLLPEHSTTGLLNMHLANIVLSSATSKAGSPSRDGSLQSPLCASS